MTLRLKTKHYGEIAQTFTFFWNILARTCFLDIVYFGYLWSLTTTLQVELKISKEHNVWKHGAALTIIPWYSLAMKHPTTHSIFEWHKIHIVNYLIVHSWQILSWIRFYDSSCFLLKNIKKYLFPLKIIIKINEKNKWSWDII